MCIPVSHADPAEFVFALHACHVIASIVLLNLSMAAGARFCVGQDPGRVFALRTLLLNPELRRTASARVMSVVPTLEAEEGATGAGYRL